MTTWRNRIVGYGEENPEQLLANPKNWRIHPKGQQDALSGVLEEVGIVDDIIVNRRTGYVLDGHLRVALAISSGQESIPVKYIDLSEEEEALILATFDPIAAMAAADRENLGELLKGIESYNDRINSLLEAVARDNKIEIELSEAPEPQIDKAEELQKKWQVKRGQIWEIGKHRLMCGDSMDYNQINKFMDSSKASIVLSDPPYGLNLDTNFSSMVGMGIGKKYDSIIGDNIDYDPSHIFRDFAYCKEIFLWGADYYAEKIPERNKGSWIVWDKMAGGMGVNEEYDKMFGSNFELCWSRIKHKRVLIRVLWKGPFGLQKDTKERLHPTQKPCELFKWIIDKFSDKGKIIVDLFLGSGTTMVAAEQLDRICHGMEIEPKYCAVTLGRMKDMGLEPRLIENAR